jgi:hypothetical protein
MSVIGCKPRPPRFETRSDRSFGTRSKGSDLRAFRQTLLVDGDLVQRLAEQLSLIVV